MPGKPAEDSKHLIDKSPKLKKQLQQLEDDGWTIEYSEPGEGTFCNRNKQIIKIKNMDDTKNTRSLAHESGHGNYTSADPYVPPKGLSRDEYVQQNVKRIMKDEGEATLNMLEVREDILSKGGPDINSAWGNTNKYENIYKEYKTTGDRETARVKIGEKFIDEERPNTSPNMTYRQKFEEKFGEYYDKVQKLNLKTKKP